MAGGHDLSTVEPFAIAWIDAPGGGRVGVCRLPGRSGALDADLARAAAEGAALVVSMTEAGEMAAKGAAALPETAARLGMGWRHFPIADYDAPDGTADWAPLSAELHALLDAGGAALLHCAGGKGRSGMVAARLLAERGLPVSEAISAVRAARPGAIETQAQEAWIGEGPGAAR